MPDRSTAPPFVPFKSFALEEPARHNLGNGVPLYVTAAGEQPVIRLEILARSGKSMESMPGLSLLSQKMLAEGTSDMSSLEISEALQRYGAFLDLQTGYEFNTLTVYTLRRTFADVARLISSLIFDASFPEKEFTTLKKVQEQQILLNREKSSTHAADLFRQAIFGKEHPYGRILDETGLENAGLKGVRQFYNDVLFNNYEIFLAGAAGQEEIGLLEEIFGATSRPASDYIPVYPAHSAENIHEEREDSLQTSIRYGKRFLTPTHPDYQKMLVVNEVLGGYFGSRLMKNIREEKGFTYGIYSRMVSFLEDGYLVIGTDVKKEFRKDTVKEINKEINLLRSEPVPEDELETVKNYMMGSFLSSINNPFSLADKFKAIHLKGLNNSYYNQLSRTIEEITALEIQQLAQRHLDPAGFTLVTVG